MTLFRHPPRASSPEGAKLASPYTTAIVTVVIAFLAAVPPTLVAWAALQESRETKKKADAIIEKAVEIHTLTNSNLHQVTSALEVANAKIEGMQKMIAEMASAKKDAQAVAMKPTEPAPPVSKP